LDDLKYSMAKENLSEDEGYNDLKIKSWKIVIDLFTPKCRRKYTSK